jgi:hypothetical protein
MTGFHRKGYTTIAMAVFVAIEHWYPGGMAEEEKRGGPRSIGTIEQADGSEVEYLEPSTEDNMLGQLLQHLFSGELPSYAQADDGRVLRILPQHWGSRHAESGLQLTLLTLSDMPSCTLLTDEGAIQGRPMIKLEDLRNLLTERPDSTTAQPPDTNSRAPNSALDDPARKCQDLRVKKQRTRSKVGRAENILRELHGDQIPPQKELSNKDLVRAVTQKLREGEQLSRDSIFRAAGRRKERK